MMILKLVDASTDALPPLRRLELTEGRFTIVCKRRRFEKTFLLPAEDRQVLHLRSGYDR